MTRLGVLADTHGLLRPRVLERLAGCDLLLHAGDVGEPDILAALAALAPMQTMQAVRAVRGNCDGGELAALPFLVEGEIDGLPYAMTHRREDVPPAWSARRLVIFGHSHRPELQWQGECLFLNPGSCGARRFRLPLTVAIVKVTDGRLVPEILSVE